MLATVWSNYRPFGVVCPLSLHKEGLRRAFPLHKTARARPSRQQRKRAGRSPPVRKRIVPVPYLPSAARRSSSIVMAVRQPNSAHFTRAGMSEMPFS